MAGDRIAPVAVVVLTHDRRDQVLETVQALLALPERPPVTVVDSGSTDGTSAALHRRFGASIRVISLPDNVGAAGRNVGVLNVHSPYVALCDDDVEWTPGSLERAVRLLDAHPRVAVLVARVVVGAARREDPICSIMAASPLVADDAPGPCLVGMLAGASVVRRSAFLAAGGFDGAFGIGAEEELLAIELLSRHWQICYVEDLVAHHRPAPRDRARRRRTMWRNRLWTVWMRYPARAAWRVTLASCGRAARDPDVARGLADAVRSLPLILARRRPAPAHVARALALVAGDHRAGP